MSTGMLQAMALPDGYLLPFPVGETWYLTSGPHNDTGGSIGCMRGSSGCPSIWSAVDIAPPEVVPCSPGSTAYVANRWVVAAKGGTVVGSSQGEVVIDHGDGWRTYYDHLSDVDRRGTGPVNQGDRLGHPSCVGNATGAHVHFAIYNTALGFVNIAGSTLSGWTIQESSPAQMYYGSMTRNGITRTANTGRSNDLNGILNSGLAPPSPPPPSPQPQQASEIGGASGALVQGTKASFTVWVGNAGNAPTHNIRPYLVGTRPGGTWQADVANLAGAVIPAPGSELFTMQVDLCCVGTWTVTGVYLWDNDTNQYLGVLPANGYNQTPSFSVIAACQSDPRGDGAVLQNPNPPPGDFGRDIVYGGGKFAIPNSDVFNALGLRQDCTIPVDQATYDSIPRNHPRDGTVLGFWSGPPGYFVLGGAALPIPTQAAFDRFGLQASDLHVVPAEIQSQMPTVPPDGTLVREQTSSTVYLIQNGTKRPFASWEALTYTVGANPPPIPWVPDGALDGIATGATITGPTATLSTSATTGGAVSPALNAASYPVGSVVAITASPAPGYIFTGWVEDGVAQPGHRNPHYVSMDADHTLVAQFAPTHPGLRHPTTIGIYRPSANTFYLRNQVNPGPPDYGIPYGITGDKPVVGDWDGDGTATIGIYRTNTFYLRNSNSVGPPDLVVGYGIAGDIPVVGDWDGDGIATIGVYRPSNNTFYLRNSNTPGPPDLVIAYGIPGDLPVVGDWTGRGAVSIGVYRPSSNTFYLRNSNTQGPPDFSISYGISGDVPIVGDWDGDGITTIGIYRTNTFYLRNSNTPGPPDLVVGYGIPGDLPVVGDWDGQATKLPPPQEVTADLLRYSRRE